MPASRLIEETTAEAEVLMRRYFFLLFESAVETVQINSVSRTVYDEFLLSFCSIQEMNAWLLMMKSLHFSALCLISSVTVAMRIIRTKRGKIRNE